MGHSERTTTYEAQRIQACAAEQLPRDQGVDVFVHKDIVDMSGCDTVTLSSDDRGKLEAYLLEHWAGGPEGDVDWFEQYKSEIVVVGAGAHQLYLTDEELDLVKALVEMDQDAVAGSTYPEDVQRIRAGASLAAKLAELRP